MSRPPITCDVNDTLELAAKLMWDHDCGAVMVVRDDGKLVGMITDRDVCMAAYTQARSLDQLLVNGAMAGHVVTATATTSIEEIAELMTRYQLRRIPIVDEHGAPIGVVALNDLARLENPLVTLGKTIAAIGKPRLARLGDVMQVKTAEASAWVAEQLSDLGAAARELRDDVVTRARSR